MTTSVCAQFLPYLSSLQEQPMTEGQSQLMSAMEKTAMQSMNPQAFISKLVQNLYISGTYV